MSYIGSWGIDSPLTFSVTTHTFSTGAATDADSPPTYRVYEDETATPILTGTMALLDGSNTVAFYSEQITLSAANGLEKGKAYTIYITATVAGVVGVTERHFQIGAEVDAVYISGDILAAAALELAYDDTAGPVPELGIIDRGTAQSATGTTLVLRSGITVSDDVLIGATAYIYSSTNGLFGRRVINDWDSATDTATVDTWTVTPTGTIKYIVYPTPPGSVALPAPVQVTDIVAAALAKFFSVDTATNYGAAHANSVVKQIADNAGGTPALASGTADSGTTTTMVDAARTEADTDYWKGDWIKFTSGNIAGQVRLITGFTPGTDTTTFAPATTQAVATQTYEIIPAAAVNIQQWLGSTVNAVISGRVDASAGALAANVLTAAAINADAFTAAKFAADVTTELQAGLATSAALATVQGNITSILAAVDTETAAIIATLGTPAGASVSADIAAVQSDTDNVQARIPAALVGGRMDSITMGMATDVINATAFATDAVNEIRDAVFARAFGASAASLTFDQLVKLIAYALLGKASGLATTTATYRNLADSADGIVATVDADGNRSAVIRTPG